MNYWVVDANIAVNTITRMTDSLSQFWDRVDREQVTPCAPRVWMSETATAIRQRVTLKEMSSEDAEDALRNIHGLRLNGLANLVNPKRMMLFIWRWLKNWLLIFGQRTSGLQIVVEKT
jgi:hypothetical protein